MASHKRSMAALGLALALGSGALAAAPPAGPGHWITSWYAAPQPGWDSAFALPMNVPAVLDKQSVRERLRLSAGGRRADYDSGDHLHPGDAGYRAMAAAVDIAPLLEAAAPAAGRATGN